MKPASRSPAPLCLEALEARDLLCNTISGHVYHDANNNGRFDPGETPLANVTLELRNAQNVVVATAVTNAQGLYLFDRDNTLSTAALTLVRGTSFPATPTDWTMTRTVEKFNPALGTLTAVEVAYNATITSHIKAESLDTAARRITANVSGTVTLTVPGLTPQVSNLLAQRFFDAAPFDGTIDFRGPSGIDFGPQSAPGSRTVRITEAAALAQYSGTGTVTLTAVADANSSATASGNIVSQINTTAEAQQVNITYTYTPSNCLQQGVFTIVQRQPDGFLDGKESRGGEVLPGSVGADVIQVTLADRDLPDNDFGEIRPSSLHGCVYVDLNNNGRREGEAAIPNAAVRLTGTDDLGPVDKTLATGADGCYRFAVLRPGTYRLAETQPANFLDGKDTVGSLGGDAGNDVHSNIPVGQGVDGVEYNFGELVPAGLGGCVYWDFNDNGVKEEGEQPLKGVKITLTGTDDLGGAVGQMQLTDDAGCYLFHTLRSGTYKIAETQPEGFLSGKNSLGNAGGRLEGDTFLDIPLAAGVAGRKYDFAEIKPVIAPENPGPGYETTFAHTRLVVPGPRDVNLLSKLQFLALPGAPSLDPAVLANVIYVEGLYRTLLHRPADLGGLRHWVGQLLAGAGRAQVVGAIWNAAEHRGIQVDNLYATFLRRPPDAAGRQFFVSALMAGLNEVEVARILLKSGEFHAAHADNATFVRSLYNRVLGRSSDNAGLQAWARALDAGFGRAQMIDVFLGSREAYGRIVDGVYANFLFRPSEPAGRDAWLNALQRGQVTPQQFSIAVLASDEAFDKARRSARS